MAGKSEHRNLSNKFRGIAKTECCTVRYIDCPDSVARLMEKQVWLRARKKWQTQIGSAGHGSHGEKEGTKRCEVWRQEHTILEHGHASDSQTITPSCGRWLNTASSSGVSYISSPLKGQVPCHVINVSGLKAGLRLMQSSIRPPSLLVTSIIARYTHCRQGDTLATIASCIRL